MKILVGFPPTEARHGGTILLSQNRQLQEFHEPTFLYPVVMATAATFLRDEGYDVRWMDCIAEDVSMEKFIDFIDKEKIELFFFETKGPVIKRHWKVADKLKERFPNLKIVICGDHVSWEPGIKETMENSKIDFAINGGDYDFAIVDLVKALERKEKIPEGIWYRKNEKVVKNGRYHFKRKLDEAPFPDRDLVPLGPYSKEFNLAYKPHTYIMSGRDCWYGRCTFCVWDHTLYPLGTFGVRSPENVLEEVKYLVDKHGVREIFDDCGTITIGNWLKKFCNLMIESGYNKKVKYSCNMRFGAVNLEEYKLMKKAGFRLLKFGLESGEQKTIDKLDKSTKIEEIIPSCRDAKKAGLVVHLTMMVGYPWESKEDAEKTFQLAKRLMVKGYADVLQSTIVIPYPGTPLYDEGVEKGWFRFDPKDYDRFDMREPVFKTPDMTPEEVNEVCNRVYTIFWHPEYVIRRILNIRSFVDLKYTLNGAKAVIGHMKDFGNGVKKKIVNPAEA